MAEHDGRDFEIDALNDAKDVDSAKIAEQILKKRGGGKPPLDEKKPDEKKPDDKKPDERKPDEKKPEVPNPETIRTDMLREMWGDQYKTVEDFKKANIPSQLQELPTLRQRIQELETQLKTKPKHNFASDDIAKFNEFARETGIKDAGVFNKLNATDVANMDPMDALILERIIEDPTLAGKEPQVRRTLERRYNVDSKKVEAGELTQEELEDNQLEVSSDGRKAKVKLQDLKGKIKMPEIPAELPPEGKTKWTPEIEKIQKEGWSKVNEAIIAEFAKIPIHLKGSKEPIVNFVLPEESKKSIMSKALDIVVNNQMEVNEANIRIAASQIYSDVILSNFEEISHAIFERARSMTEEEYLKTYSNPSPRNTDTPPGRGEEDSDEARREKAYQAEMKG